MPRHLAPAFVLAVAASALPAAAQCQYTSDIFSVYNDQGAPTLGQQQSPLAAWTYERTTASGVGHVLLEGVVSTGWQVPDGAGAWGAPAEPFYVPIAGLTYTTLPGYYQNPFHYRDPSFNGIMLHPGYGAIHGRAVYTAQSALTLSAFTLQVEDLGQNSGGALVTAYIERSSGPQITLVPLTNIVSLAAASVFSPTAGFPMTLSNGDRIVIETSDGGNPAEDWMNINATLTLTGRASITSAPVTRAGCGAAPTVHIAASGATSFHWRFNGALINNGPTGHGSTYAGADTATLTINNYTAADAGAYSCDVSNTCGTLTSVQSPLAVCLADFNCDATVNSQDFFNFLTAFFAAAPAADFNHDGSVNSQDFFDFLAAFFSGC